MYPIEKVGIPSQTNCLKTVASYLTARTKDSLTIVIAEIGPNQAFIDILNC